MKAWLEDDYFIGWFLPLKRLKTWKRGGGGKERGKTFSTFPKQALVFSCLQYKSFENTVGKGEIDRNEQFLLFPQYFLPVWRTFAIFVKFKIVVCKVFQFGRVYNLSFGKGLRVFSFFTWKGPLPDCAGWPGRYFSHNSFKVLFCVMAHIFFFFLLYV